MSLWMDTWGAMANTCLQGMATPWTGGSSAGRDEPVGVHVEVTGGAGAVSLSIAPGLSAGSLTCPGLRSLAGGDDEIRDVEFEEGQAGEAARVRIGLEGQPAGDYSGVILDRSSNRPVGGITVTVRD